MMKKLKRKLRSRRGETLTETLFAVLLTALAVTLLLMMLQVSTRMNLRAEQGEQKLYAQLSNAEANAEDAALPEEGSVTVTVRPGTDETAPGEDVIFGSVKFYGEKDSLVSYRWEGAK